MNRSVVTVLPSIAFLAKHDSLELVPCPHAPSAALCAASGCMVRELVDYVQNFHSRARTREQEMIEELEQEVKCFKQDLEEAQNEAAALCEENANLMLKLKSCTCFAKDTSRS